ncbi:MAG: FAD-binding domain-containing protein [Acidocella sp.]|nr:FAD-binding domain-containing protein [Acidocella sp.]
MTYQSPTPLNPSHTAGIPPTRAAALARLEAFAPRASAPYTTGRNTDPGPGEPGAVSHLSAYLRYRLITEHEVIAAIRAHHSAQAAEKFIQEVLWRTYWKGWLEHRPAVWRNYQVTRQQQHFGLTDHRDLANAETGTTGIDGFDDWARELIETGHLHNHARMWFASIWVFSLRLPWALGADFFLRHLRDADAASNTLSWRWVAGLHTAGKTYLATAENIARYTDGRYAPKGLAQIATPLSEPPLPTCRILPDHPAPDPREPSLLLVTSEDLHPECVTTASLALNCALIAADPALLWGKHARRFAAAAAQDCQARVQAHFNIPATLAETLSAATLIAAAQAAGTRQIVTPYIPVGPVNTALAALMPELAAAGVTLTRVKRSWDQHFWPHATAGFFAFKSHIPATLAICGLP